MLHTKFHGNQLVGSGVEDYLKVFPIYGHGARPSWSCDQHHINKISFPCT